MYPAPCQASRSALPAARSTASSTAQTPLLPGLSRCWSPSSTWCRPSAYLAIRGSPLAMDSPSCLVGCGAVRGVCGARVWVPAWWHSRATLSSPAFPRCVGKGLTRPSGQGISALAGEEDRKAADSSAFRATRPCKSLARGDMLGFFPLLSSQVIPQLGWYSRTRESKLSVNPDTQPGFRRYRAGMSPPRGLRGRGSF